MIVLLDFCGVLVDEDYQLLHKKEDIEGLSRKATLCIVSNASYFAIKRVLEREKIAHCFKAVAGKENLPAKKPAPEAFFHIMKELNARPQECIFIDDSLENCKVAQKLGIKAIHYTPATNLKEIV